MEYNTYFYKVLLNERELRQQEDMGWLREKESANFKMLYSHIIFRSVSQYVNTLSEQLTEDFYTDFVDGRYIPLCKIPKTRLGKDLHISKCGVLMMFKEFTERGIIKDNQIYVPKGIRKGGYFELCTEQDIKGLTLLLYSFMSDLATFLVEEIGNEGRIYLTTTKMGERLNTDRTNITDTLKILKAKGLIERVENKLHQGYWKVTEASVESEMCSFTTTEKSSTYKTEDTKESPRENTGYAPRYDFYDSQFFPETRRSWEDSYLNGMYG